MKYRPEIDGLRALAVVAVIVHHFDKGLLPSGYLGVDVFFVISGYVITASLHGRSGQSLPGLLLEFYARRVKRLLPALIFCVLGTSILISLVNPSPSIALKTGLASLFGLSNLYLIRQTVDYFGDSAQLNAFTHTWSLAVEEQFYAFFPFIVWLTSFRRREAGGRTAPFYSLLGVLGAVSLAAFVLLNHTMPELVYYLMPTRFWELAAGAFAFWLTQRMSAPGDRSATAGAAAGLTLLLTLATLSAPAAYNTATTIAATALTVGLIALTRAGTTTHRLFTSRAFVYVGLVSYSLYLWHWPVLVVSRWSVGIRWWTVPVQAAAMLLLAALSYHWVEKPLRTATWSPRQSRTIAYGLGTAAVAAAVLLVLIRPLDGRLYAGRRPSLTAAGVESLSQPHTVAGTTWNPARCVLMSNRDVVKTITPEGCTLGDFARARRRVLVLGNSHAAAFTHAFDPLVSEDGFAVTIVSSWGASPVRELPNRSLWQDANRHFWNATVPPMVARLQSGDWVLLLSDLSHLSPPHPTPQSAQDLALLQAGLRSLSAELAGRGIRLAMLRGLPYARDTNCDPAATMDQWFAPFGGPCTFLGRDASLERRSDLDRALDDVAGGGAVTLIDLFDLFCPGQVCGYQAADGTFLYRDMWSHPSVEAARLSAPLFRRALHAGDTATAALPR